MLQLQLQPLFPTCCDQAKVLKQLKPVVRRHGQWQGRVRRELERQCVFTGERFQNTWTSDREFTDSTAEFIQNVIQEHIPIVLAQFATTSSIAWIRTLSEMLEDAATVLITPRVWGKQYGVVLELTPESDMWKADFKIRG